MQSPKLAYVIPSILGILGGIVTSVVISFARREAPPAPLPEQQVFTPQAREARTIRAEFAGRDAARIAALESQVAALASARGQADTAGEHDAPDEQRAMLDPAQRRELFAKEVAEADRRFSGDPVDPEWTRRATGELTSAVTAVGEKLGYQVVDAECRTQFCRATLRWSNASQAQERSHFLAEMMIPGLNCAQTSLVPDPDEGAPGLTTRLFLDCADLRTGRADEL